MFKVPVARTLIWQTCGFALLLLGLAFISVPTASAAGVITVDIVAGYNLVVDSNVMSPSTYAPSAATVMGRFCNTGDATLNNVFGYIGNFGANTPGIYQSRGPGDAGFNTTYPHLAGRPGRYSFSHVGGQLGTADASRFLGNLAPGECKVQYWHVTYPRRSNGSASNDNNGPDPIWGDTNVKTDDLWLEFNIWGRDAAGVSTGSATWRMTMRNEISAMANKIKPNPNGQWFNTNTATVLPGETITSNGIDYELGVINQGFDNDGDLVPDFNAWLQPIGDPSYDPSCFRLIGTEGYLTISRSAMPDLVVPFTDQLYFTNLPTNNNGVVGRVYYTFMALGGPCSTGLTPYQEVASGYENEKFNGDYGTGIPPVASYEPEVTMTKGSAPNSIPAGSTTVYTIPFANSGAVSFGLGLSTGGTTPFVVTDAVPDGMQFVAGSATYNLTYANTGATILYSTNSGVTWSGTDPGNVTSTWPNNKVMIQWWLNDALPAGSTGNYARFTARVPVAYAGEPFIENCAEGSLGGGVPFVEACAPLMVQGTNSIGDFVWRDLDADGVQDGGGETGIANILVTLYWDRNNNGQLDDNDAQITTTNTNGSGIYSFTGLPNSSYLVKVDRNDSDLPVGTNLTTREVVAVPNLGTTTPSPFNNADFGFGPSLQVTKKLISSNPAYVGELVTFDIDLTNTRPGDGTPAGFCTYTLWSSIAHANNALVPPGGGPTNSQWLNTANSLNRPDGLFASTDMSDNTDLLGLSGFNTSGQSGAITNVKFVAYAKETANLKATDNMFIRVFHTDVQLGTDYAYNGGTFFTGAAGTLYTLTQDVTALRAWTWTDFANNTTEMQIEGNKGGGGGASGDFGLDGVAYIVTTNEICGGADDTISYLPLVDSFDTTYLQYVSANPAPSSTGAGTLTWNNLGPLYAGGTTTVRVTFRALAPIVAPGTTNTATVTNPTFMNGRLANNGSDTAQVEIRRSGSIAGTVWADTDNSGWSGTTGHNAGDGRLINVRVDLYACISNYTSLMVIIPAPATNQACTGATNDGTWTLVATTYTNSTGDYLFSGLRDGFYNVKVADATLPATFTTRRAEANPAGNGSGITCGTCDSQWNTDAANLSTFNSVDNSSASDNITSVSFGYRNPSGNGAIMGYVWNDVDQDGVWDSNEYPIPGVTIYLCASAANPCNAGSAIATTTTDANGFYAFERAAGNYRVGVLLPSGMSQSGDTDVPGANCGGSCDNQSNTITLPAQGANGPFNFGYFGGLSIGDTIYMDWNGNGSQGAGEEGISGVAVNLYRDANSNGVLDAGEPLLSTQTTNASGLYLFSNLPGNGSRYIVRVNSGTLPAGVNQTGDPGEAGTCVVCDDTHAVILNAANVLTADFGYRPFGYASIGDTIWSDTNANGIQEASETGVNGVTVQLYQDQDGDGILDAEDALVASTTTNASGYYIFEDLAAGNYIVRVAPSNFTTGQPLSGRTLTQTTAPHNATQNSYQVSLAAGELFEEADLGYASSVIGDRVWQDNDGDGEQESGEPGVAGVTVYLCTSAPCTSSNDIASDVTDGNGLYEFTGLTARTGASVYVVAVDITTLPVGFTQTGDPDRTSNCAAGGSPACDNSTTLNLNLGQIDRSRDFGYQPTAFIGDTVWIDTNANGVRDPGEAGIGAITVRLCADAGCVTVIATTATDADGYYTFGNVSNGTYFVRVDTADPQFPAGLTNTYDPDGTTNSTSQVIVSGNQVTSVGGTACTNCSLNVDFGYRYVGSNTVSGTIFFDAQNNGGIYNPGGGDTPFANVTVYLRNSVGLIIATTTTDAAGFYSFTTLPNGTYTVVMDANAPQLTGLTQRSEPDNLNCGACNNTTTFTLNNANLTNQDFGFFGNIDCGDAPASYNTLLANQGPCHMINGTYLGGSAPDAEANGQPDAAASGDGADDSDGVARDMLDFWVPSTTVQIQATVTGSNGYLVAWFDWNNDGDFADAGEQVNYGARSAGVNTLNVNIPASYTTGQQVIARFRLYSGVPGSIASTGLVSGGEIEDYRWLFGPTAVSLSQQQTSHNSSAMTIWLWLAAVLGGVTIITFWQRRKLA